MEVDVLATVVEVVVHGDSSGSSGTWCIQGLRRSGTHSVDEHGCRGTWRHCGLQVLAEIHIGCSRTDLKTNLAPKSNLPVLMNLKGPKGLAKALPREVTGDRSSCWMLAQDAGVRHGA